MENKNKQGVQGALARAGHHGAAVMGDSLSGRE